MHGVFPHVAARNSLTLDGQVHTYEVDEVGQRAEDDGRAVSLSTTQVQVFWPQRDVENLLTQRTVQTTRQNSRVAQRGLTTNQGLCPSVVQAGTADELVVCDVAHVVDGYSVVNGEQQIGGQASTVSVDDVLSRYSRFQQLQEAVVLAQQVVELGLALTHRQTLVAHDSGSLHVPSDSGAELTHQGLNQLLLRNVTAEQVRANIETRAVLLQLVGELAFDGAVQAETVGRGCTFRYNLAQVQAMNDTLAIRGTDFSDALQELRAISNHVEKTICVCVRQQRIRHGAQINGVRTRLLADVTVQQTLVTH